MNETKEINVATNKKQNQAQKAYKANGKSKKPLQLKVEYTSLLARAVSEPGLINAAYRAFHNYSLGNQMLAAEQLISRGLNLTPIASYNSWLQKNRQVKRNEKAIALYMPVQLKAGDDVDAEIEQADSKPAKRTALMLRNHWFSLEQTEGEAFIPEVKIPEWDATKALELLNIVEKPFSDVRGNIMGYAMGREIAINPLNPLKHKTRFHEMAHIVLGHTETSAISDLVDLPRSLQEAEAEGVAYILTCLLNLDGQAVSRAYIQSWLAGRELPDENAKRIFVAANKIMEAGQQEPSLHFACTGESGL